MPRQWTALKWQDVDSSVVEAALARGGPEIAPAIQKAFDAGAVFDSWQEHFKYDFWQDAFAASGLSLNDQAQKQIPEDEKLPWHMITTIDPQHLKRESLQLAAKKTTPYCRESGCTGCVPKSGLCMGKADNRQDAPFLTAPYQPHVLKDAEEIWYTLIYSRTGPAKYLSHLSLGSIWVQVLRIAGIRLSYSKGFSPKPRVSFFDPLPLGMESHCEGFAFACLSPLSADALIVKINECLPAGLSVQSLEHTRRYLQNKHHMIIAVNTASHLSLDTHSLPADVTVFKDPDSYLLKLPIPLKKGVIKQLTVYFNCTSADLIRAGVRKTAYE